MRQQDTLNPLRDRGYAVVENLIDDDVIESLRRELHEIMDKTVRKMHEKGELPDRHADAGFDHQLARISQLDPDLGARVVERFNGEHGEGGHMGPAVFALITHTALLDAVASIVGPEIIGSSVYRIRPKAPGLVRGAVPWHQDSGYLMPHCDRSMIITCWIPLVDADEENGCLFVIPEAHRRGILEHRAGGPGNYLIIEESNLPADLKPMPVPVPRGGVLFMTNMTPHASFENRTDRMRWSIDLRYQGAEVPHNVGQQPVAIDRSGSDITIACHPPEADFVLRSPSRPQRVVRTWQQLKKLRDDYFAGTRGLDIYPDRWKG